MRIGLVTQSEGCVAAADERGDFSAQRGADSEIDGGMFLAKAPQALGKLRARECADHCQRDRAAGRAAQRVDGFDSISHRRKQCLRMRKKRATGLGEHDSARDALEQRRAQFVLEKMHAAADRGLRQMECRRCSREAAAPHDR
jgi:hypothetical protein